MSTTTLQPTQSTRDISYFIDDEGIPTAVLINLTTNNPNISRLLQAIEDIEDSEGLADIRNEPTYSLQSVLDEICEERGLAKGEL